MARKAKTAAPKGALDTTKTMTAEDRFNKHVPGIQRAKKALERAQAETKTANGEYRNKLKAFKSDGGDIDALIDVMKDQKREIDEVESYLRNYNAYAKFIGLPIGTQLGFFDGDKPKAANGKAKANGANGHKKISTKETIASARAEGKSDGEKGKTAFNTYADGSPEALAYSSGYNAAQEKLVHETVGRPQGTPTH